MKKNSLLYAWIVATIASLGAFYFEKIKGLPPCDLCWQQRMCMVPLVLILARGLLCKEPIAALYAFLFSIPGLLIALIHTGLQAFPSFFNTECTISSTSCSEIHTLIGPLTIPMLSVAAFILINNFLYFYIRRK